MGSEADDDSHDVVDDEHVVRGKRLLHAVYKEKESCCKAMLEIS